MEALQERQEDREADRNVHKLNWNKRATLTTSEIERLKAGDRPLAKEEWGGGHVDR